MIWVWFGSEWFSVILLRSGYVGVGFLWRGLVIGRIFFGCNRCFWCDFGDLFWRIWCDIIEVRLGLSWFMFGVVWCLLMWFGVICTFFVVIDVLWWFECDLVLNDLVWYYWGLARSELVCFLCGFVSFGVLWCDFYIFGDNRCFIVWFECDLFLNDLLWYYWGQVRSELACFGVFWCSLVWFVRFLVVIDVLLCDLSCDLFVNDLVWYYWGLVRSEWVCCGVVWWLDGLLHLFGPIRNIF